MLKLSHDDLKKIASNLITDAKLEVAFPVSNNRKHMADVANEEISIECKPWYGTTYIQFEKISEIPRKKILFMHYPSIFDELWLISEHENPLIKMLSAEGLSELRKTTEELNEISTKLRRKKTNLEKEIKDLEITLKGLKQIKQDMEKELSKEQKIAIKVRIDIASETDQEKCLVCGETSTIKIRSGEEIYGLCNHHLARIVALNDGKVNAK